MMLTPAASRGTLTRRLVLTFPGGAMAYITILYELAEGVATLTFNRPEVRNAFDDAMAEEVQSALKNAERDENVRCVVITGAGQGFCAGQDLAALRARGGEVSFREHLQK